MNEQKATCVAVARLKTGKTAYLAEFNNAYFLVEDQIGACFFSEEFARKSLAELNQGLKTFDNIFPLTSPTIKAKIESITFMLIKYQFVGTITNS